MFYIIKLLISAGLIVLITEVAKNNVILGGLIKSLPLVSLLSIMWLYFENKDTQLISDLSISTIWFVISTLPMFYIFSKLLNQGVNFFVSLFISILIMFIGYFITMKIVSVE